MYIEYTVGIGTIVLFVLVGFLLGLLFKVKRWHRQRIINLAFSISKLEPKSLSGGIQMTEVTLTNEQKVKVSVAGLTEGGQVVPLDNLEATIASGDGSVQVVDPTSFYAASGSLVGDTLINVVGTIYGVAILGDLTLHVTAAKVVGLQMVPGSAEIK